MRPRRDNSSSVAPPTLSPTHSCPSSEVSSQLENTPHPLPPLPFASDEYVDDISDIDVSDSDDDLSHVNDAIIVSSIIVLSCTLDIVYFNAFLFLARLFRFPKAIYIDAKILRTQAKAKRKNAIKKCKLADADFRVAKLKARLCRQRVREAKHLLEATNVYAHHVKSTIQRSKYRDVKAMTAIDRGQHGTKGTQTISTWMRAAEQPAPSKSLRQYSRRFIGYNT